MRTANKESRGDTDPAQNGVIGGRMREPTAAIGRWIVRGVEGRVHQHVICRTLRQSRSSKRIRRRGDVEADGVHTSF